MKARAAALEKLCRQYEVEILYAFGSRGREAYDWLTGQQAAMIPGPSDLDVAIRPARPLGPFENARLALDLVVLPEAGTFLAANAIRGERLYARDEVAADEYDLYILRRAGDLAPIERERQALILGKGL